MIGGGQRVYDIGYKLSIIRFKKEPMKALKFIT